MTQRPYTGSCVKKKSRLQIDGCNVADFWYAKEVLDRGVLPGYTMHFGHSFSYYSPVAQQAVSMMVAERKVIQEMAKKQDCVIEIGRAHV